MAEKERRAKRDEEQQEAPGEVIHLPAIIEPGILPEIAVPDLDYFLDIPEGITFDEWQSKALEVKQMVDRVQTGHSALDKINDSGLFRVGDWLLYGAEHFEEYSQMMDDAEHEGQTLGYSISTLKQAMWVCQRIPKKQREPRLYYRHHMLVAGMEAEERKRWLKRAVAEGLSSQELRRQIRGITKDEETKAKKEKETVIKPLALTDKGLTTFNAVVVDLSDAVADERDKLRQDNNHELQLDLIEKYAKKLAPMLASLFMAIKDHGAKQAA